MYAKSMLKIYLLSLVVLCEEVQNEYKHSKSLNSQNHISGLMKNKQHLRPALGILHLVVFVLIFHSLSPKTLIKIIYKYILSMVF